MITIHVTSSNHQLSVYVASTPAFLPFSFSLFIWSPKFLFAINYQSFTSFFLIEASNCDPCLLPLMMRPDMLTEFGSLGLFRGVISVPIRASGCKSVQDNMG